MLPSLFGMSDRIHTWKMQVQSNNVKGTWKKRPLEDGQLANATRTFWSQGKTKKIWRSNLTRWTDWTN